MRQGGYGHQEGKEGVNSKVDVAFLAQFSTFHPKTGYYTSDRSTTEKTNNDSDKTDHCGNNNQHSYSSFHRSSHL